jgi:hypothetical protein
VSSFSGFGRVAGRTPISGLSLVALLAGVWLLVAPQSPDLAAQVYRTRLFEEAGFALWDNNWYAGHHLPAYSLLYPWLSALMGVRLLGVLAALVSTWAFGEVALAVYGRRAARWAAPCFALAAAGDLWIGRITFALGAALAVLAVLALVRRRAALAGALALLCAAGSPVAGLLLAFAGVTHVLHTRQLRPALVLVLPPIVLALCVQALFPEGGWEPFAASGLFATLAASAAFLYALPSEERLLRTGVLLYVPVTLLSLLPTPMGANVQRYGVVLAAPLLVCGLVRSGFGGPRRPRALVAAALAVILTWVAWGPVHQTVQVLHDSSTRASYYLPVRRFLAARAHGGPVRIEVPFTKSHWDAALLAPYVALARGWERQLDKRYDSTIEADPLAPGVYRRWLLRNAVSYVALPDAALDDSSIGERALIERGVPYLREELHTAHWRIFSVLAATPLASAPAAMVALSHDSFALRFARGGSSLVRIRYTRYWTLTSGSGCVRAGPEGWTQVSAARAGVVRVAARFSISRALGLGGGCS